MTVILRCVLIVVSILLTFFVLKKIRQSKVKIEDSIFWVMFALMMVVTAMVTNTDSAAMPKNAFG